MDESAVQRVAHGMDVRRADLGLQWQEVAERAGTSALTLRRFRAGYEGTWTRDNIRAIERALQWPRGHIDALVAGDPLPQREDPADADFPEFVEWSIDDALDEIARLAERLNRLRQWLARRQEQEPNDTRTAQSG